MLITSDPVSVGIGQTVKLFIQPSLDGKTVAANTALLGLTYASSNTDVANLAPSLNDDGSIAVTISQAGTVILTSQAQISNDAGVIVQSAQGQITLTVTAVAAPPTNPAPQDGGLLMTVTVS